MGIFSIIYEIFWWRWFWLPPNVTWADVEPGSRPDIRFSGGRELLWAIPVTLGYIILRLILQRFVLEPIGKAYGIKHRHSRLPKPNPILENVFTSHRKLNRHSIIALMKQTDLTERQIERWWRCRINSDQPTTLDKFCEITWQVMYSISIFTFGCFVVYDKPYVYNFKLMFVDWPFQSMDDYILPYYVLSLGYYCSLTMFHFIDAKRKDFWQMLLHHFVTISLLLISWHSNHTRHGAFVLMIHDAADILLYLAKMFKYMKLNRASYFTFFVFLLVWIVTRIVLFGRFFYTGIVSVRVIPLFVFYFFFLTTLYVLHWYWTMLCFKILVDALRDSEVSDVRSDSSDVTETDSETSEDEVVLIEQAS